MGRATRLATCALFFPRCKLVFKLSSRCQVIEWIVTEHGRSFSSRLFFVHWSLYNIVYLRGGNLDYSFSLLLLLFQILVRGCGTLGKALVLRVGMCGFGIGVVSSIISKVINWINAGCFDCLYANGKQRQGDNNNPCHHEIPPF